MEMLKEILRIVTSRSDTSRVFPELNHPETAKTQSSARFLAGMANDTFQTDDEAAKEIYGTNASDQRYRTLKSRTYERLLQSILFLQVRQPEHSEYLTNYYKCMRNMIGAQTLMKFASRKAGYAIASKTLTVAERYEFTDICLTLTVMLRESAAIWYMRSAFVKYHQQVTKYMTALQCEYEAEYLLDQIKIEMNMPSKRRAYLIDLHKEASDKIQGMLATHSTHALRLNALRAIVNYYDYIEDFNSVMTECDNAIAYLDENPHLAQKARYGEFRLQQMSAALYLRRYEQAHALSDACINSFTEAGNNWYFASDLAFVAAINLQDYARAEFYHTRAVTHRKYSALAHNTRERWILYGAYLNLAEKLGLYTPAIGHETTFRLTTYLNSLPEEAKSKKVYNVLIIISHVIFLILNNNLNLTERRIDYLRVYSSRYLREPHFNRVRIFLRLIQALPRLDFDPKQIREGTKDIVAELVASAKDPMPSETNELIPFEVLFEALLQAMERNPRY